MRLIEVTRQRYEDLYKRWLRAKVQLIPSERQRLFGLTVAIGGVCGLAAVAFHLAIRLATRQMIDRALGASGYSWAIWTVVVPTLGAVACGLLLQYVVPNARGSGVPQVKVAYGVNKGRLRLRDSIGKFGVSMLQIGSGSSLGREGPTVQICAGVATTLGRLAGVSHHNLRRLLPVGAAAGIAAAFNAPIAAVTFTIEEIVGTLDQTLLSGVIVAAALAAVVERSVLGEHPVFKLGAEHGLESAFSIPLYALLGVAAAAVSVLLTSGILRTRLRTREMKLIPLWARPGLGGLITGLLAVTAILTVGSRGITGGGYEVLSAALAGNLGVRALLVLSLLKLIATVGSYGTGGAGGIFAPALFIGAMLGGAFGAADVALFHHAHVSVGSFALVGMGAVFAGVIRAPITSVLIIIEMTGGYSLILPLMIANMVSYGLARQLQRTPIYEALLEQDGVQLQQRKILESLDGVPLRDFPLRERDFVSFVPTIGAGQLIENSRRAGRQEVFPVVDLEERLVGVITLEDLATLASSPELDGLVNASDMMRPPVSLELDDDARTAFELMVANGLRELPVVDQKRRVLGFIDEVALAHAFMRTRTSQAS